MSNPYHKDYPITWEELHRNARALAWRLLDHGPWKGIIAITRGGLVPAAIIARELDIRLIDTICISSYGQRNEVKFTRNTKPLIIPLELMQRLAIDKQLEVEFNRFSKSKQHEFALYIAAAKRTETKAKRLEKIIPMILSGEGLNDRYKKS